MGQPFEVIKTQLAANRGQSLKQALTNIYNRGGVFGFYQGLIPWAWIEASTKGAVLLFTASEFEYHARAAGASPFLVSFKFKNDCVFVRPTRLISVCFREVLLVVWVAVSHKLIQQWVSVRS